MYTTIMIQVYVIPAGHCNVYSYSSKRDRWTELAPCPHRDPGLGVIERELIAVGGWTN